ncbi:hypothetical protein PAXRUDRAFT_18046 [Paxillus rubicundulus Ve08.2h10]|uniref:SAM domain-containing protein n=1 Tax=Paxillus rubicundulus Ve08.2h10 TaxID=930991 RepID=A0A0D0D8F5_9AGAM|nr:hypothetical protein PAXRUDRAFT_18046 [Paxillus rubicundulus Ve08.2h10]
MSQLSPDSLQGSTLSTPHQTGPPDTAVFTRPSDGWLRSPAWIEIEETREVVLSHTATPPSSGSSGLPPTSSGPTTTVVAPVVVQRAELTEAAQNVSLDSIGHLVSISMVFSSTEKPASNRGKPTVKKLCTIKSNHIMMDEISRIDFVKAFLRVHEVANQYSPGVHFGPQFKLWWTGSSGGKTGASTIENDHDFEVARTTLLKKRKDTCAVSVEFNINNMDGYRIRKRPILQVDQDNEVEELAYGTKVPRVEAFSEDAQIHGGIILQLKAKWVCEKHLGEHGEVGYCYVSSTGEHLGLNHRKLKLWAAAIASADATKHAPPNSVDFDGVRDGRLNSTKPHGRSGPRFLVTTSPDATTMLLAATILDPPSTPSHHREVSPPLSPTPLVGTEIYSCLHDLLVQKGIDLCGAEGVLTELDLTPDIIADVPISHLCDILGTVEGRVLKLQAFAHEWHGRLQLKRRRLQ